MEFRTNGEQVFFNQPISMMSNWIHLLKTPDMLLAVDTNDVFFNRERSPFFEISVRRLTSTARVMTTWWQIISDNACVGASRIRLHHLLGQEHRDPRVHLYDKRVNYQANSRLFQPNQVARLPTLPTHD